MTLLQKSFAQALDEAWDSAQRAVDGNMQVRQPETPKPTVQPRIAKGYAQDAVLKAIKRFSDKGATRTDIRRVAGSLLAGQPLKENTLKIILKSLRDQGRIELKVDGRWWPKK